MRRFVALVAASVVAGSFSAGCAGSQATAVDPDPVIVPLTRPLPPPAAGATPSVARISFDKPQQSIDGFGFSTAWGAVPGSPENEDAFFSVTKGAGFNIVRTRVPFREKADVDDKFMAKRDGAYTFTTHTDAQGTYKVFDLNWNNFDLVKSRDMFARVKANPDYRMTTVFSTPWTPPNNAIDRWKLPTDPSSKAKVRLTEERYATDPEVGGSLDPKHYQDYADVLADYVLGFEKHMGFPLEILSIQNEPSFECDYESCDWTSKQFHDFLLVLDRQFERKGVWKAHPNLKIMAPEHNNLVDDLLADTYANPKTAKLVSIFGGHQYEYGPWQMGNTLKNLFTELDTYQPDPLKASNALGKRLWMTEWNMSAFGSVPMTSQSLVLARVMHQDFAGEPRLHGFVFWWSPSVIDHKTKRPNKILWTLAQYSRFVRPGWRVLEATKEPERGVYVTAFARPETGRLAVVVVNINPRPTTLTLDLSGASGLKSLSLYRTSATEDIAPVGAVSPLGKSINVEIAPSSISTYYGEVQK